MSPRLRNKPDEPDADSKPLLAGDLLVGADKIKAFLIKLGMPKHIDIYYLKRAGSWPIGNTGGKKGYLIASKHRLIQHAEMLTRGDPLESK